MKNKKLLYGAVLVAGLVGLYLWDKNKKSGTCSTCSAGAVSPQGTPTSETFSAMGGYANAGGGAYGLGCRICERQDGSTYFAKFGGCADGDFCVVSNRPKKSM